MTDAPQPAGGRNRLADESSPYLLQHADNPVHWYPWGDEAFEAAREQDKPILLSVGYSACHWCHVMAHESFENEEIAALMNEGFISIKVDREERPDVDSVYMTATQALAGQGGWPMTVFMTADGQPFYAGPGFQRVLQSLQHSWQHDRARLLESAEGITERLRESTARANAGQPGDEITAELLEEGVANFRASFDAEWGGFGGAPKFPSPGNLEFLLMHHARVEGGPAQGTAPDIDPTSALGMALHTLRRMAAGGMYDQLGGGFARYSVDARWLVPHFEKMLYDNAQLARSYLHAFQITGEAGFERVVHETLAYLEREMLDAEGGFYSAQDADSEGIEGKYFVWTPDELRDALAEDDAALFSAVFGVTDEGNFEDPHHPEFGRRTVLNRHRDPSDVARDLGIPAEAFETRLPGLRATLFAVRGRRVPPGLDDKALTSWNGLALAAFAEAGRVLGEARYVDIARRNADFVRSTLWRDGRLLHSYKAGVAKVDGMLEDYTYYGLGLLELYRATGDIDQLRWATQLFEVLLDRFRDESDGAFFETATDAEELLLRQKPFFDAPTPSGNGAAALLGFWLGRYLGRPEWEAVAEQIVGHVRGQLAQAASGFGSIWQAAELLLAPRREIAIVGDVDARAPFERELGSRFLPAALLVSSASAGELPVLEGRTPPVGAALAYVCEDFVCALPADSASAFAVQLDALAERASGPDGVE